MADKMKWKIISTFVFLHCPRDIQSDGLFALVRANWSGLVWFGSIWFWCCVTFPHFNKYFNDWAENVCGAFQCIVCVGPFPLYTHRFRNIILCLGGQTKRFVVKHVPIDLFSPSTDSYSQHPFKSADSCCYNINPSDLLLLLWLFSSLV